MYAADVASRLCLWLNVAGITLSVDSSEVVASLTMSWTCAALQNPVLSYSDIVWHTPIAKVNQALERCAIVYPQHDPLNWLSQRLHQETPVLARLQRPVVSHWITQNHRKWNWNDWNGFGDIWRNISNGLSHTRFLHVSCALVKLTNGKFFFLLKSYHHHHIIWICYGAPIRSSEAPYKVKFKLNSTTNRFFLTFENSFFNAECFFVTEKPHLYLVLW